MTIAKDIRLAYENRDRERLERLLKKVTELEEQAKRPVYAAAVGIPLDMAGITINTDPMRHWRNDMPSVAAVSCRHERWTGNGMGRLTCMACGTSSMTAPGSTAG